MSRFECPVCNEPLTYVDYFGQIKHAEHYYTRPQSWIERKGEMYQCNNEECEGFQERYYAYDNEDRLRDGVP